MMILQVHILVTLLTHNDLASHIYNTRYDYYSYVKKTSSCFNDSLYLCRYPFDSPEASKLNRQIFETIYYGAMEASCELAEKHGTYETYQGCPVSKGVSLRGAFQ